MERYKRDDEFISYDFTLLCHCLGSCPAPFWHDYHHWVVWYEIDCIDNVLWITLCDNLYFDENTFLYTVYLYFVKSKANNWGYNEDITKSYLWLEQTKVCRRKILYFSFLSYDFWFQSSRGVYVKFAEKLWIFLLFMALKFVVGYWGRIWGAELLCGRVERKSTAIFDWSGLLSLSGQQCFCGDINFKRHMLFSWYRIVSC